MNTIEPSPDITCVVCGQNVGYMHEDARHVHVNGCLDRKKRKSMLFKSADDSDDNIFDVKPTKRRIIETKQSTKPKSKSKMTKSNASKLNTNKTQTLITTSPPRAIDEAKHCGVSNMSDLDEQLYENRMRIGEIEAQIAELQADKVTLVKNVRKLHRKQLLLQAPLETSETTCVTDVITRIFKRHTLRFDSTSQSNCPWWNLNQQMEEFDRAIDDIIRVDVLVSPRSYSDAVEGMCSTSTKDVHIDNCAVDSFPCTSEALVPEEMGKLFTQLNQCLQNIPHMTSHPLWQELACICRRGSAICHELVHTAGVESTYETPIQHNGSANCDIEDANNNDSDVIMHFQVHDIEQSTGYDKCCGGNNLNSASTLAEEVRIDQTAEQVSSGDIASQQSLNLGFDFDLSGLIASSPPLSHLNESSRSDEGPRSGRLRTKYSLSDVFHSREERSSPTQAAPITASQGTPPPACLSPSHVSSSEDHEGYLYHYSPSGYGDERMSPQLSPELSPNTLPPSTPSPYNDDTILLPSIESPSDKENNVDYSTTMRNKIDAVRKNFDLVTYSSETELLQLSLAELEAMCSHYGLKTTSREVMLTVLGSLWRRLKNVTQDKGSNEIPSVVQQQNSTKTKAPVTTEQVISCIKSQRDIYEKILSFIPVEISDVQRCLTTQGLSVSAHILKDMLDNQAVFVAMRQE